MKTDYASLIIVHALLAAVFIVSLINELRDRRHLEKEGLAIEFNRGEKSMNSLYVMYGFATVSLTLAVQVSECLQGNKSALIILDYLFLTYLFFYNRWFRNSVVLTGLKRIRKI